MTTATVAAPTGNQFGVLVAMFLLIAFITAAVLWLHEKRWDHHGDVLHEHTEQLATLAYQMPALLEYLGVEIDEPVEDDSPDDEEDTDCPECAVNGGAHRPWCSRRPQTVDATEPDDCPTDEIPIAPATVPDGMPLAVQSALIEQRPSPVPRGDSDDAKARKAAWVETELAKIRERIDAAQEAS